MLTNKFYSFNFLGMVSLNKSLCHFVSVSSPIKGLFLSSQGQKLCSRKVILLCVLQNAWRITPKSNVLKCTIRRRPVKKCICRTYLSEKTLKLEMKRHLNIQAADRMTPVLPLANYLFITEHKYSCSVLNNFFCHLTQSSPQKKSGWFYLLSIRIAIATYIPCFGYLLQVSPKDSWSFSSYASFSFHMRDILLGED